MAVTTRGRHGLYTYAVHCSIAYSVMLVGTVLASWHCTVHGLQCNAMCSAVDLYCTGQYRINDLE